jgi:hypothetical protein
MDVTVFNKIKEGSKEKGFVRIFCRIQGGSLKYIQAFREMQVLFKSS